ncbi:hypothetical protein A2Z22_03515 [Candidatus Woesebacteria bacterium RBG_16_34_12]|uniref:Uncharacterized protein n=1 Tax=Candidatus Woesebacteria bacterium RBG_16_34_12 TaxID=1802480 RepID=A0A1F7XAV3_9BACT|nr:MAG: hypothetical protein A2Z22_03515 [Candidatus Woesebacteria bacterium RBG_16_34_12]
MSDGETDNPFEEALPPQNFQEITLLQLVEAEEGYQKQSITASRTGMKIPEFDQILREKIPPDERKDSELPFALRFPEKRTTYDKGDKPLLVLTQRQAIALGLMYPGSQISSLDTKSPSFAQLRWEEEGKTVERIIFLAWSPYYKFGQKDSVATSPGLENLIRDKKDVLITGIFVKPSGNSDEQIKHWGNLD